MGKMFGYAYYVGRKLCISLYEDGVGVKLHRRRRRRRGCCADPHVTPFQPLAKPKMPEWVRIDFADSQEYRRYAGPRSRSLHPGTG
ncbi:MAG: hypothetical protein U0X20_17720 [Caldilineaceae bacterium]